MNTNEIKIIGVGGCGQNVLRSISSDSIENADYIACNTDVQSLDNSKVQHKLQLGVATTKSYGTNGDIELGRLSSIESKEQIEQLFDKNSKTAIFIAGLGGGTGTGSTPVMVQIAKEKGLFTIAIVLTPFKFEGKKRNAIAQEGVAELKKQADFVLVIDNNKIVKAFGNLSTKAGFGKVDEAVGQLIQMLISNSSSDVGKNDIKIIAEKLKQGKSIFFGFAQAQGEFRERKAIEEALKNALSDRENIDGIQNVFLHMGFGNRETSVDEMAQINEDIIQNAGSDADITPSILQDLTLGDSFSVMVIAS